MINKITSIFLAVPREATYPRPNLQKWLCTDGKTWRAGDKRNCVWFTVKDEAEADAIIKSMEGLTSSQIYAASKNL